MEVPETEADQYLQERKRRASDRGKLVKTNSFKRSGMFKSSDYDHYNASILMQNPKGSVLDSIFIRHQRKELKKNSSSMIVADHSEISGPSQTLKPRNPYLDTRNSEVQPSYYD